MPLSRTTYGSPAQAYRQAVRREPTVIGGGATVSDETYGGVVDSSPSGTTGWTAHIYNGNGSTLSATVTAICAPAAATTGS